MASYWKKKPTGAQKELNVQLLTSLREFSCRSCIVKSRALLGSGIRSLFITKRLVTNISAEWNVENCHNLTERWWGEPSTHPHSNIISEGLMFDWWFSADLWFLLRHLRGETVHPQSCICSLLKNKNLCQVNRNQSRELPIWQWMD